MSDQIFYTEGAKNSFFLTFSNKIDFQRLKGKAEELNLDPDGYILAPEGEESEVDFFFYNKDGSMVDFCGNALRATGLCFYDQFGQKKLTLKTAVGFMQVEYKEESLIKAQMPKPKVFEPLEVLGKKAHSILSGVEHLVYDLGDFSFSFKDREEIKDFCKKLRSLELENKKQTFNLTFYSIEKEYVDCITFERGVEDFTEACGSGALSTYIALDERFSELKMPGGLLKVYTEGEDFYMEGPAKIIKRIQL